MPVTTWLAVADERKAREAADQRKQSSREGRLAEKQAAKLQSLFDQMSEGGSGEVQNVNLVIKADVQGSVEALRDFADAPVDRRDQGQCGGLGSGWYHRIRCQPGPGPPAP